MTRRKRLSAWAKLKDELKTSRELCEVLRQKNLAYYKEITDLRQKVTARVDTAMMETRIRLANALGQMVHAQAEAIKFVIGKECL